MSSRQKTQPRRQTTKKHKKIKAIDPFYTGDRKNVHERKNINLAPNNDIDHVPRMWKELMQLKEKYEKKKTSNPKDVGAEGNFDNVKKKKIKKSPAQKRKQSENVANTEARPLYTPIVQKKDESDLSYFQRTQREVKKVFEKSRLSNKYKIQYAEVESGEMKKPGIKAKKKQRLKEIAKLKKEKKEEHKNRNSTGFEHFKDDVVFGEVVMAPPVIKAKPRKADTSNISKPGRKQLLLKNILEQNSETKVQKNSETKPKDKKATKLKYLSLAKQSMLSEERERVVKLYREMKKKNHAIKNKK